MSNKETENTLLKKIFDFDQLREERLKGPKQQIIELEMRKRHISAKEWGRILPDKKPDYIGNFETYDFKDYQPRGIFEIFIEKNENNNFSGIIEDCFGTATFKGNISSDVVSFIKHYIPEKSSVNASKVDINYEGSFSINGEYYIGKYFFQDDSKRVGDFCLSAQEIF